MSPVYNDPSGGLAGGLCLVSPSDQSGMIDNLLSRVAYLEQVVSLILGHDITAGNLAEITDQLGTVTNATLINAANGWIDDGTFTGVALSSLGWQMADGNTYPVVLMQDGVLVFGFAADGTLGGTGTLNTGGTTNYIVLNTASGQPGANVEWGGQSLVSGNALEWSGGAADTVTITRAGTYIMSFVVNGSSGGGDGSIQRFMGSVPNGWPFNFTVNEMVGVVKGGQFNIGTSLVFIATAATTLRIAWNGADDPSGVISQGTLIVARI